MKWANIETKHLPVGQSANLLRENGVVSYGKIIEKITTEQGTRLRFQLAGYGETEIVEDITHFHVPKAPGK